MSQFDDLEKLGELKKKGILTDKEFQIQKERLLNSPIEYDKPHKNMWDYYADRHKGACIRIDYKKFIQKNNFLMEIPIDYSYSKDEYFQEGLSIQELMSFKDKIWSGENEIRFIRKRGNLEDYCTIRGCIDKIFLGVDFDKEYGFNDVKINNLKTLCDLVKRKKDIDPHWFSKLMLLENGNLSLSDNGALLWYKMMKLGVDM